MGHNPEVRRAILSLSILAVLGIAALAEASERPARSSDGDAQLAGSPALPKTLVAPNAAPVGPSLTVGLAAAEDGLPETLVVPPAPSKVDRRLRLVEALLLEKYLAFRESLTSP